MQKTTVSAPGKVLITGGYLVLDPKYSGLVLTTTARFYSTIQELPAAEQKQGNFCVKIHSPQFHFTSQYNFVNDGGFELKLETGSHNKYIELSVLYTLCYVFSRCNVQSAGIELTVQADNDFYSQIENFQANGLPISSESYSKIPKCYAPPQGKKLNKTGLGSSAALVTSIIGCILAHFKVVDIESSREVVHRLAQFCHCLAQGKIGSGFDVSSATFGTQTYRKFNKKVLEPLLVKVEKLTFVPTEVAEEVIVGLELDALKAGEPSFKTAWDHQITEFSLPDGFHLFVADVNQGSETPSMVANVLEWRAKDPENANALWEELNNKNMVIADLFIKLKQLANKDRDAYNQTLQALSEQEQFWNVSGEKLQGLIKLESSSVPVVHEILQTMQQLRSDFLVVRSLLKKMGEDSGSFVSKVSQKEVVVPIEPNEQSDLLNETMNAKGCLFAGVPGAGGFDAIFSLAFGKNGMKNIEQVWRSFSKATVCPLPLTSNPKGIQIEKI